MANDAAYVPLREFLARIRAALEAPPRRTETGRRTTMTRAWRAILFGVFLGLIIPGIVWLSINETLGVISIVALVVILIVGAMYLAVTRGPLFWAWALGVTAILLTPALLSLGGALGGEARPVFYHWIYVYCAGAVGGLVLELLIGRGRLELPSVVAPDPASPSSGAPPISGGQSDPVDDPFSPYGTRFDIGFFARITLGGVAAAAFVVLIHAATKKTDIQTLSQVAKHFDTLGLAAIIGAVAITAWKSAEAIANSRLAPLLAAADATAPALDQAHDTLDAAATQQADEAHGVALAASDLLRSREVHAALAQETDPDKIVELLGQHMGRVPGRAVIESMRTRSADRERAIVRSLALVDAARASLARVRR
jgi:hypothetical protein